MFRIGKQFPTTMSALSEAKDSGGKRLDLLCGPNVGHRRSDLGASCSELVSEPAKRDFFDVGCDYFHSSGRGRSTERSADPTRRAGNDGDLACKFLHPYPAVRACNPVLQARAPWSS